MTRSFVSVCTGDKYPDRYVDILYNMVSRHTDNFNFFGGLKIHPFLKIPKTRSCQIHQSLGQIINHQKVY